MASYQTIKLSPNSLQILLNDESILVQLVYKEKQNQDNTSSENHSSNATCDLTGNPLEASFFIDSKSKVETSNTETVYVGFPLKEARKYLNNFRICENKINIPLWICCEDSNNENIILLSINEKDLSRSVVYKKGIINLNLFSQHLTKFKNKHLSLYDNFEIKMNTSVLCHYDLLNPLDLVEMNNKEDSSVGLYNSNKISLTLNWKELSIEKPSTGIEAELVFKIELNNENSPLKSLYENLITINNQFLIYNEKNYSASLCKNKNSKSLEEIYLILRNEFSSSKNSSNKEDKTTKLSFYETLRNIQNSSDITSLKKLWIILSECQNLNDLSKAIQFIYKEVQSLSLWIDTSESNKPVLIQNIKRTIFEPNFKIDEILPSQALEMLLEIGIHSLIKEYFKIFQSIEFTFHQCELRLTSSYTDILPTLGQLHTILEILVNLNNENINKLVLQEICEEILAQLRVIYPNLHKILQCNLIVHRMKVNYFDIEESIVGLMWKYFRISLHSENKFSKWNSVLLFSEKYIFSNFYSDNMFDCTLSSEDDMFFTTEMLNISEKI